MITVSIAAISLGVGIDYVIHVIERFRKKWSNHQTLCINKSSRGASGLALVGSALSDIAGFLVIMQSSMGFFSTFGLFCAVMIGLALVASMVLAPAALRTMSMTSSQTVTHDQAISPSRSLAYKGLARKGWISSKRYRNHECLPKELQRHKR